MERNGHVLIAALEQFEAEYESTTCAACKSEKWANSPFCRSCSIRLQRANLMRRFNDLLADVQRQKQLTEESVKDWGTWAGWHLRAYWGHYDLCRDYLINVAREKAE